MFCKYCGYEYQNENVRFCPSCGRSLENEVIVVENVEPEETQEVTPVQQQVVYQQVPPLNNIPVNTNGILLVLQLLKIRIQDRQLSMLQMKLKRMKVVLLKRLEKGV